MKPDTGKIMAPGGHDPLIAKGFWVTIKVLFMHHWDAIFNAGDRKCPINTSICSPMERLTAMVK